MKISVRTGRRMAKPMNFHVHIQTALHRGDGSPYVGRMAQPIRQNNRDHWSANGNDNRTKLVLG